MINSLYLGRDSFHEIEFLVQLPLSLLCPEPHSPNHCLVQSLEENDGGDPGPATSPQHKQVPRGPALDTTAAVAAVGRNRLAQGHAREEEEKEGSAMWLQQHGLHPR